ncbi:MAG: nucleotidyl transferase AbiEii/AbiGii toxin family protein [Verrucomicrobiota bacterium]
MTGNQALLVLLRAFHTHQIPYMVTGGYAFNFWGPPRSTKDADIVVEAPPLDWPKILHSLPEEITLEDQLTFETITGSQREILRIKDSSFFIEVFHLTNDPFNQQRFQNRVSVPLFPDFEVSVARAEDVIIQKLRWFHLNPSRRKDFDDAVNIFKTMPDQLQHSHIEYWCRQHNTFELLQNTLKEARSESI